MPGVAHLNDYFSIFVFGINLNELGLRFMLATRTLSSCSRSYTRCLAFLAALMFLSGQALAHTPCTLSATQPSVTICEPANGATVTSPVHIVAGTNSGTTVTRVEVWVDGVKKYQVNGHDLDIDLEMPPGTHRLTVQAYNGTYFKKTVYVTVSGTSGFCTPSSTSPSVTICTPPSNSTVSSPVGITAVTNSSTPVQFMQVYVDGIKKFQSNGGTLNTSLAITSGTHRLTVQAYNGTYFKATEYITVSGGTQPVTVAVTPEGASIPPGGSLQFTANVSNTTNKSVTWWVDGVQGGNSSLGTISSSGFYTAPNAEGSHKIMAVSVADPTKSAQVSVGVSSSAGCTPGTTNPSVTICTPKDGDTVDSPVHVQAVTTSSTAVRSMQIYVDGVKVHQVSSNTLDTEIAMTSGTHRLTVQADNGTTVFKKTIYVTATNTPQISVSVSPASASIATGATQQFTASVQDATNTGVTWSVDGIQGGNGTVGLISNSGLYTAPNTDSRHTITATSVADPSKSGNASVTVGTPTTATFPGLFEYKYGNDRRGANLFETTLMPSNVNAASFGKKWTYTVDGYVYAQPLYVPNLTIGGRVRDVIYVATEHNSVYAFDASGSTTSPLWKKSFLINGATTVPQSDVGSTIYPEIGITGTPVIDPATNTLYVVAVTKESGSYVQRLHALDLITGSEKFGGPKKIEASVSGTGDGNVNGTIAFQAKIQLQRPALALVGSTVYIAWASHGDNGPYHGWVLGYNKSTLSRVSVHNNTPNGRRGGIWMSGGGMAVDGSGNLYYISGNGTFTAHNGGKEYGDSIVKLSPSLTVLDYFTPFDQANMNSHDIDLGVGGPTLLPGGKIVFADKKGSIYLVNMGDMGKYRSGSNSQISQYIDQALGSHNHSQPAYWNGNIYISQESGPVHKFSYDGAWIGTSPVKTSKSFAFPGVNPVISADGNVNGIMWVIEKPSSGGGVLRAYNALTMTELYNSAQSGTRDSLSTAVKFTPVTVANGKVIVGLKGQVAVFGLLK